MLISLIVPRISESNIPAFTVLAYLHSTFPRLYRAFFHIWKCWVDREKYWKIKALWYNICCKPKISLISAVFNSAKFPYVFILMHDAPEAIFNCGTHSISFPVWKIVHNYPLLFFQKKEVAAVILTSLSTIEITVFSFIMSMMLQLETVILSCFLR